MATKKEWSREVKMDILDTFYRLQSAKAAHKGLKIDIPEIVICGGQSEGKSSIIEAFLGFRFNVVITKNHSGIGTKSPILIQMRHDPKQKTPRCRIKIVDHNKVKNEFVEVENPRVMEKMIARHYEKIGDRIVNTPVEIRVDYAESSDLSLIDLPGLINNRMDKYPPDTVEVIHDLVLRNIQGGDVDDVEKASQRYILFVESSEPDYENSPHRKILNSVDPYFKRTTLLFSKLDCKANKLSNMTINNYFGGGGSGGEVMVSNHKRISEVERYYVCLPSDVDFTRVEQRTGKHISGKEFTQLIAQKNAAIKKKLLDIGLNEKYSDRIGFNTFRVHLEKEIFGRYVKCIPAILQKINDEIYEKESELREIRKNLKQLDESELRKQGTRLILEYNNCMKENLRESKGIRGDDYGETLEEEKKNSADWPDEVKKLSTGILPAAQKGKIAGGAQFIRLCSDVEIQIRCCHFKNVGKNEYETSFGVKMSKYELPQVIAEMYFPEFIGKIATCGKIRMEHWLKRLFGHSFVSLREKCKEHTDLLPRPFNPELVRAMSQKFQRFVKDILDEWEKEFMFIGRKCSELRFERTGGTTPLHKRIGMEMRDLLMCEMISKLEYDDHDLTKYSFEDEDDQTAHVHYTGGRQITDKDYFKMEKEKNKILFKMRDQMADLVNHVNFSKIIRPLEEDLTLRFNNIILTADKLKLFSLLGIRESDLVERETKLSGEVDALRSVVGDFRKISKYV